MILRVEKFLKPVLIVLATLMFLLGGTLLISTAKVYAYGTDYSQFLPVKSEEYYALNSPIHVYSDNDITAVTENDKIVIFTANGNTVKTDRTSLKQINRVGDNLLFADNGPLYYLPLSNLVAVPSELKDDNATQISGAFFDTNGQYLVTSYSAMIQIYRIGTTIEKIDTISATEHPVAVNTDSMFYVAGTKIQKRDFNDLSSITEYQYSAVPTSMVADDEFIYYFADSKLYRLDAQDASATPQTLNFEETDYELGVISSPQGLAFKNGNLLIVDGSANGSVQEFKITDNGELEFTGYAIASGLSAYNRISKNAENIERNGRYVAALDDKKLTVIDTDNSFNYDKDGFINLELNNAPDIFALGTNSVLYAKNGTVKIANITLERKNKKDANSKIISKISEGTTISGLSTGTLKGVSYQSGKYYAVFSDENNSAVAIINETDNHEIETVKFIDSTSKVFASCVTADVFGNIYIATATKIYKNDTEAENTFEFAGAEKLCSDLAGNLFILKDGKIYKLDGSVAYETTLGKITAFGLNFDRNELFFTIENKEGVYSTTKAGNISLEEVIPDEGFISATKQKAELILYTVKDGANVYSVTANGDEFNFNGLTEKAEEYPLISKIELSPAHISIYALASENGVVLVNKQDLADKTAEYSGAPAKVYARTAVYAYAIPVTEQHNAFVMKDGDNDIRLEKGTEITVNKAFTVQGKTFYDASVLLNGETLNCYIPADFTATALAQNTEYSDYTIEKVKDTVLYQSADLTDEITTLTYGTQVKVLAKENGALKVAVTIDGAEKVGYIPENALAENPNTMVRNVLIILAVFASLAGTISFFLLRKKQ